MTFNVKKPILKAGSIVLLSGLCAASIFSVKAFARDVYVSVDNNTIHSVTFESNVDEILGSVGVRVSGDDIVEKIDDPDGSLKLNVKRSFEVSVSLGSVTTNLRVVEGTVSDALESLGVKVNPNDIVNYPLDAKLEKGMKINVIKTAKVTVLVDGEEKECFVPRYWAVKDALKYVDVSLSDQDSVNCDLEETVSDEMRVEVSRVNFEEVVKTEPIAKQTVTKTSSLLESGEYKVETEGEDGQKEIRIKQTLKDGEVVDSEVISETVVKEPTNKVVIKGTGRKATAKSSAASSSNSESSSSGEVSKVFYGSATAYTASKGARTSTGNVPVEGQTVAVDPRKIPYGSRILVETADGSYRKEFIAQDTGGALRKGSAIVDIYMNSNGSCRNFGRKSVKVSIIK